MISAFVHQHCSINEYNNWYECSYGYMKQTLKEHYMGVILFYWISETEFRSIKFLSPKIGFVRTVNTSFEILSFNNENSESRNNHMVNLDIMFFALEI